MAKGMSELQLLQVLVQAEQKLGGLEAIHIERAMKHLEFVDAMAAQSKVPEVHNARHTARQHHGRVAKKAQQWMIDLLQVASDPQSFEAAVAQALLEMGKRGV